MIEAPSPVALDIARVRQDFPILSVSFEGRPLVYLDNASTSQKPTAVLDKLDHYWRFQNSNVHRGVHHLSHLATKEFDGARKVVQTFLNAASEREIVFTKGCTEGINLVTNGLAANGTLAAGDVVLVSTMEHHSNIVPWQLVAQRVGATVVPIPISDAGEIDLDAYRKLLFDLPVRVVGVVHVSNSLGTVNPIAEMVRLAHEVGALVLVDGAQAGPHELIDVQALDADFYTLSCHKIYAPTGVGVLYGKLEHLDAIPPYQGGGDMIRTVSFEGTTYAPVPAKFEAGTPNIAGVIGLGAAIEYMASFGGYGQGSITSLRQGLTRSARLISDAEAGLVQRAEAGLSEIPGIKLTGTAPHKASIVAFTMEGAHAHDIGTILDQKGVAIRAGHHCCMPLMKRLGVAATARASFAFYNDANDVDSFLQAVHSVRTLFG